MFYVEDEPGAGAMTHDGQSAARVSGPCFAMGEAAGIAAAMASARDAGALDPP